jgi:hypothetical protein
MTALEQKPQRPFACSLWSDILIGDEVVVQAVAGSSPVAHP